VPHTSLIADRKVLTRGCSVEILCGEEPEVVNHGPQQDLAGLIRPPAGAAARPGRRSCRLDALPACHRRPDTRLCRPPSGSGRNRRAIRSRYAPPTGPVPPPRRNTGNRRADAEVVAGVGVKRPAVERPVPEQGVDPAPPGGRAEPAGVVPGAAGGGGRQEQVGAAVGDGRELRPPGQGRRPAGPPVELEDVDAYAGRAARAAARACRATASADSVIGRVPLIPHWRALPDLRISTEHLGTYSFANSGAVWAASTKHGTEAPHE
jgi:hypothetical protein